MLGNYEKTVITHPTRPNKWTQIDDHMASSGSSRVVMDQKPAGQGQGQGQDQQLLLQQQQQALRCPRCDSSNTKFCYYNNYSLSQPRHFCKACKRYWTRGGTLRNVPVGGGCRKNKRVKRPSTTSSNNNNLDSTTSTASPSASSSTPSSNNSKSNPPLSQSQQSHIDSSTFNPLLYGLNNNSCDVMNMNHLSFPSRFGNSSRYDQLFQQQQQPQLNALGLGFSSSEVNHDGYRNGLISSNNHNSFLSSNYNSIFGGSTSSSTSTPVMASLLSSTNLLQQKFTGGMKGDLLPFHGLASLQEIGAAMVASKEVKGEGQNYSGGGVSNCQNQMEHMGFSDPSLYWNNNNTATTTTALGGATANWSDQHQQPNNIGPSVTSLI